MPSVSVYSIYLDNVDKSVVDAQKKVLDLFLPDKWTFEQVLHQPKPGEGFFHATALEECIKKNTSDIIIFLDIDCVPLSTSALTSLADQASKGFLTGAVQRANHLQNQAHLYVGPFCMAFLISEYKRLGVPSLKETYRGDCAEELTYVWEDKGSGVKLLWPSDVYKPSWNLREGIMFGYGTTYEYQFYHSFCIRQHEMQNHFINKCKEILVANPQKKIEKVIEKPKDEVRVEVKPEPKKVVPIVKETASTNEPSKEIPTKEIKSREVKKEVAIKKESSKEVVA